MSKKVSLISIGAFAAGLFMSFDANSAEAIKPAGPVGGTDINQAFLPPPGLYVVGVGVALHIPNYYVDKHSLDADGHDFIGGGGLVYVYKTKVFGGSLASSVFDGYESTCFGIKNLSHACATGMSDIYSDVLMWSRYYPSAHASSQPEGGLPILYGLNTLVGLGVSFPTGRYKPSKEVNDSANVYVIAPNVALTYTSPSIFGDKPGQATEFSGRLFINNYTKNSATNYQSGRLASLDFAVTQRINRWQFGLAGTGYSQFQDDKVGGVKSPNNGNRTSGLSLGPIVSYNFIWGRRPWILTLKETNSVYNRNTASADGVVLRVATKGL